MRILQFGRFWNEEHGGVERHAALLCKGLTAQGADVVNLVAALPGKRGGDKMHSDGYRLIQVPSYGMVVSTAMAPTLPIKALSLHKEDPFDIFHLHFPDPLSHLASLILPKGVPRVITWHSDVIRQKRLLNFYMPFLRRELRQAAAVISGTEAHFTSSTQIPSDIPSDRKHVIPYGIDYTALALTEQIRGKADVLRRRALGRPLIFALGRHVYYKGFHVLIEAMRKIDALLYLGGSGPLLEYHRSRAIELGVSDRIIFCGRIPEHELAAYFHACDVFCLPSVEQSEAFGLVQLEAMACGKPVVASQLHNGVNVVNLDGITGVTVRPRDAENLAQAVSLLLADAPRMAQLGHNAYQRAHNFYSLGNMADQTAMLYRSLLN